MSRWQSRHDADPTNAAPIGPGGGSLRSEAQAGPSSGMTTTGRPARRSRRRPAAISGILARFPRTVATAAAVLAAAPPAWAQEDESCAFLCAPELKVEPTVTFGPIFRRPVLEELEDGLVVARGQPETDAAFELIVAVGVPTTVPRVGLTLETIFVPFGDTDVNPFTGVPAGDLGRSTLRGNEIEFEVELNLSLIEPQQSGGWVDSHFDIVDKISAAERPTDMSAYTHKLNFEWDTAVRVLSWLPDGHYLRDVEVEGSLDYVATGLPRAGDVVGSTRYVTDESPWSFSLVFVLPVPPLR